VRRSPIRFGLGRIELDAHASSMRLRMCVACFVVSFFGSHEYHSHRLVKVAAINDRLESNKRALNRLIERVLKNALHVRDGLVVKFGADFLTVELRIELHRTFLQPGLHMLR
jgi:hypothetical protein